MLSKLLNIRTISLLCLYFFLIFPVFGQTGNQFENAGDQSMIYKDFYAALVYFQEAHTIKDDEQTLFKLARAAYYLGDYAYTNELLLGLLDNKASASIEQLEYLYGLNLLAQGKYQSAKKAFQSYLLKAWYGKSKRIISDSEFKISWCNSAMFYAESSHYESDKFTFELVEKVNSPFSDYAPLIKGKSIWFSSSRANEVFCLEGSGELKSISPAGLSGSDEISFFQVIGNNLAICCLCKAINEVDRSCNLQYWDLEKNQLNPVGGVFSSALFTVSQPFVDLKNAQLYFSSNGFESLGNRDLFNIALDSLESASPKKISFVNSIWNEESPYLHGDTLFFSSDRPQGLGGYDIFYTVLGQDGPIRNMGIEVNSPYDEKYFAQDDSRTLLGSNRPLSKVNNEEEKRFGCYNIFFRENKAPTLPEESYYSSGREVLDSVTLNTGFVDEPLVFSSALFFPNNYPLKSNFKGRSYQEIYDLYLQRAVDYLERTSEPKLFKAFMEDELIHGMRRLDLQLDSLISELEKGKKYKIELKSFSSPRAEINYNLDLSLRRSEVVMSYLLTVKDEKLSAYVENGQLVIRQINLGESQSPTNVSSDILNKQKSVYSVKASKERRVEISCVSLAH